jgi:glutamine amidotransferase
LDVVVSIAIIDYGAGNLRSAAKALERAVAGQRGVGPVRITNHPGTVAAADRVVLPGDGAFRDCRRNLDAIPEMVSAIDQFIDSGRPFLGICVGMQLLADRGLEHGETRGLGRISGEVRELKTKDPSLKVPHMGWNTLDVTRSHALTDGLSLGPKGLHAYFLHAYEFVLTDPDDLVATSDYGGPVTAIVARENVAGTQFHPEKSQALGLGLIDNFVRWRP